MEGICYFDIIPNEIKDYIISLTTNKIFDLCQVNKYFNDNCKILRITKILYSKNLIMTDINMKKLTSLTTLKLCENNIITDEGIKNLINLKSLRLFRNKIITNEGIKGLSNLTSLNLHNNKRIASFEEIDIK